MIKGVNRQVIEITQTKCEYFEKVLFFVKPEYAATSEGTLRERAGLIADSAGIPPASKAQKEKNYLRAEIRLLRARGSRGDGADIISALNNSCKIRSSRRRDSSVCVRCTPPCREARSGGRNRCSF